MLSPAALANRLRPSRTVLNVAAVLVAAYALSGFLLLPYLVKSHAPRVLGELTGRTVAVDAVQFNPFTLALTVDGFRLLEADGSAPALAVDRLHANLELESVLRQGAVLHELRIEGPRLKLWRAEDGRLSWADILDHLAARPAAPTPEQPARFSLANIQLSAGQAEFDDRAAGVRHELTDLALSLPFLSNLPVKVEVFVQPALSAMLNGHALNLGGKARPFAEGRETALELGLDRLDLAPYLAYLPFKPAFALRSGHLSTELRLSFEQLEDGTPKVALSGELRLGDIAVDDAAGAPVLAFEELALELADLRPLVGQWHFNRLRLQAPELHLVRQRNGRFNLQDLMPPAAGSQNAKVAQKAQAGEAAPASAPIDYLLAIARLRDGVVHFEDRATPVPFTTRIEAINLDLRDLASRAEMPAVIRADFVTDAGERFDLQQHLRPSPFELEGSVSVEGLQLARLQPYYLAQLDQGELREGRLDVLLHQRLRLGGETEEMEFRLETATLRELVLGLKGHKRALLALPELGVSELVVKPVAQTVQLGSATLRGLALAVVRDAAGELDAERFLAAGKGGAASSGPAWRFELGAVEADAASLRFEEQGGVKPVVIQADQLAFKLSNLGNAPASKGQLALNARIDGRGRVAVDGSVALNPLAAELDLDVRSVDLRPLQAYVPEDIRLRLASGNLSAQGRLSLALGEADGLRGGFRGNLGLATLALTDTRNADELLRWRSLRVQGVDLALAPLAIKVRELALSDFHSRLVLDAQGRLNLREVGGTTPAGDAPQAGQAGEGDVAQPAALPPVEIGRILFRKGSVAFSDRFVRPNYDARLTALDGELSGLSTAPDSLARLQVDGKVDDSSPLAIVGSFNLFRQDKALDIKAEVRDFELTGVSTYSGKYVGYGIEKGKLSAELEYRVEDRKLSASHRVFLDQLTFGAPTDSPDAIKAPVQLAVALLKNRQGEIDIRLPVSGTLDDPQFSIGGLVFRALMNLIGKAVTAPFALLGSMFGGGEDLSQLPFAVGVASLDEAALERLRALSEALRDRPVLKLEVAGGADPEGDAEGLRRAALLGLLRAEQQKALREAGEEAPALEDIPVTDEAYPVLLRKIYRQGDYEKERNFFGFVKEVPVERMEAAVLAGVEVAPDAVEALARQRAQAAKNWLAGEGGVAAERIFVVAPQVAAAQGESACGACVKFAIK